MYAIGGQDDDKDATTLLYEANSLDEQFPSLAKNKVGLLLAHHMLCHCLDLIPVPNCRLSLAACTSTWRRQRCECCLSSHRVTIMSRRRGVT